MAMSSKTSAYEMIQAHGAYIKLRLYTPAHQGERGKSQYFPDQIYDYDFPFLTRSRTEGVEQYFSQMYNTKHTFFLTGGATQGMLVACAVLARKHCQVAIGLNSHIAVIHGLVLAGLEPFFIPSRSLMPTAEEVMMALEGEGKGIGALLLTHPSYEGFTTDVQVIINYCRDRNITLVMDEVHGSHFPFLPSQWNSVLVAGGDLVVHSLHKYVGSFVQTAFLHLPEYSSITVEEITTALALFESTTRSNLLILSIEDAINTAFGEAGRSLFAQATQNCQQLRERLQQFGTVLTCDLRVGDPLKIYLISDRVTGEEIGNLLYERGIDYEYADDKGVLLIFSFQHTQADFDYVSQVLEQIHQMLVVKQERIIMDESYLTRTPRLQVSPKEAFFSQRLRLPIEQANGKIICVCLKKVPPGIPILIPGEEITDWHLQRVKPGTIVEVM